MVRRFNEAKEKSLDKHRRFTSTNAGYSKHPDAKPIPDLFVQLTNIPTSALLKSLLLPYLSPPAQTLLSASRSDPFSTPSNHPPHLLEAAMTLSPTGVFSPPLFTPDFCNLAKSHLQDYRLHLTASHPSIEFSPLQTLDLLHVLGLECLPPFLFNFISRPLGDLLITSGAALDWQQTYTACYESGGGRTALREQSDDSEVTVNLCL